MDLGKQTPSWKKTGEIVHKIKIETKNTELRNELQQFSIQMIKNSLKFTPCGLFDLSYYFVRDKFEERKYLVA
ncbi:Protein of unknown function [Cotesia congregata]|uniref:Uncharacterized protein n=1 Tax=Cotesia congregata TaxID=51543 RepID=A0A8J2HI89_COTCN|nr:Protein of unknown function [Cotesia congregata]